jgi:ABC-type transport system involved in multi-copper enzyme maturation permease subunit
MNLSRIVAIASNVFREVIRDRILYLIALFVLVVLAATLLIPNLAAGTGNKIILDLGLAAMNVIGLIVAVFVGTGLINKEIEKRTVFVLIAKPMSHVEFIVGKHLGLSAVLAVLVVAMTAIYFAALMLMHIQFSFSSLMVAVLYIFLELSLLTAVAIAFGVFTSSLLATLFSLAVYLMGHLSQDLLKLGKITKNPGIERLMENLYLVLPDLERLNLKNQAVYGLLPDGTTLLSNAAYGVLYTTMLLAIATLIFSRREF